MVEKILQAGDQQAGDQRSVILVTRPEVQAGLFVDDLTVGGYEAFVEPMSAIVPLDFHVPDFGRYQGLIFTSANALDIYAKTHKDRSLPVYVVGRQTQEMAYEHGFKKVYSARGKAADLVDYIKGHVPDVKRPLLHVRSTHLAYPLKEALQNTGYNVGQLIVYDAPVRDEFSTAAVELLQNNCIQAVTFFSKRTAENFLKLIEAAGLEDCLAGIKALCISETVLQYVRPELWQNACVAAQPDRQGMLDLIAQNCVMRADKKQISHFDVERQSMSKSENKPIENAGEVIERFGGIRPMAKKIDVAVTTIQGWKKRDIIPAARRQVILDAAMIHNVDLTDILPDAPAANENNAGQAPKEKKPDATVSEAKLSVEDDREDEAQPVAASNAGRRSVLDEARGGTDASLQDRIGQAEKHALSRHSWLIIVLVLGAIIGVVALLWPQKITNNGQPDRLSALEERTRQIEGEMAEVQEQQNFFGTLLPENLDEQLASLQDQAGQAKEKLGQAVEKAQEVSADVLAEDAGTLTQRAQRLEKHLQEMTGSPVLAGMLEKIEAMQSHEQGQRQIDLAMEELSGIIGGLNGQLGAESGLFESTLDSARGQSAALGQTFESVPATDLKAAAMLLAMTQFRSSLNRDNAEFENDFSVLMGLVGEDDVELRGALEKLAPHAQSGVLTPAGVTSEFKALAGDAVMASLQGEDVSLGERAKARMNEVLQVEKDGELISGTETQAKLAKADALLEEGNIEEAIATVETLDGPAGLYMAEWVEKANVTLMAQKFKAMLQQNVSRAAHGNPGGITAGSVIPGRSTLIQNEETGINILK
ncbi:MAG: uroporphyrinogen-III synthase [Rhodospirillales bacterium]|nr:uroporphyrinogen-III synthase [Rhodospirillales bacterium]